MPVRLAIYASHPNQHFAPVFQRLAALPGIELKAFYNSDEGGRAYYDKDFNLNVQWDVPLLSGYPFQILTSTSAHQIQASHTPKTLIQELECFSPDFIWVFGYNSMNCLRAIQWGKQHSSVMFLSDSQLHPRRNPTIEILKKLFLPRVFQGIDRFITIGDKNEAYFSNYAVHKEKMVRGAYPADIQRFQSQVNNNAKNERIQKRNQLKIKQDAIVTMFVGKLTLKKRPHDLIHAYAKLKEIGIQNSVLAIVGDGPLRKQLESLIQEHNLQDTVRLLGFINQREMANMLTCADIIALPSENEPYGLVIAEAMIFGAAVVVSDSVGCIGANSSARPNENALVYPCGKVAALADCIERITNNPALLERMKRRSLEIVPTQDVTQTVRALTDAMLDISLTKGGIYQTLSPSIEQMRNALNSPLPLKANLGS